MQSSTARSTTGSARVPRQRRPGSLERLPCSVAATLRPRSARSTRRDSSVACGRASAPQVLPVAASRKPRSSASADGPCATRMLLQRAAARAPPRRPSNPRHRRALAPNKGALSGRRCRRHPRARSCCASWRPAATSATERKPLLLHRVASLHAGGDAAARRAVTSRAARRRRRASMRVWHALALRILRGVDPRLPHLSPEPTERLCVRSSEAHPLRAPPIAKQLSRSDRPPLLARKRQDRKRQSSQTQKENTSSADVLTFIPLEAGCAPRLRSRNAPPRVRLGERLGDTAARYSAALAARRPGSRRARVVSSLRPTALRHAQYTTRQKRPRRSLASRRSH